MSLPGWVNTMWNGETTYDKLRTLGNISLSLYFSQTVLRRLTGGQCCHQLIHRAFGVAQLCKPLYCYSISVCLSHSGFVCLKLHGSVGTLYNFLT